MKRVYNQKEMTGLILEGLRATEGLEPGKYHVNYKTFPCEDGGLTLQFQWRN